MQKYFTEARSLLALGIPIVLAQFSQTAMGFVDTVMAGSVSEIEMSAVAVGFSIWLPAILFGQGILMALTPIVAQMNGSGRRNLIGDQIQQGLWLALLLALGIMCLLYNSQLIISNMPHIDKELADKSVRFLHAIMWVRQATYFIKYIVANVKGFQKPSRGW